MRKLVVCGESHRQYPVFLDPNLLERDDWLQEVQFPSSRGVIITNSQVGPLYGEEVSSFFSRHGFNIQVVTIPDGEEYKNLSLVEFIYDQLLSLDLDRKSFLLALGGGVITDITGFVASTFLRGIVYFSIPTTLLAQVDSSIGGKTGVNLPQGKNLVGTFYPPWGVFIDLSFLHTLPPREYEEGLAEVAKTFFLAGGEILSLLEEKEKIISREEKILEEIVFQSLSFKKKVVEKDEREKGLRSILNYGHTIGHALERVEGYGKLRHGEAVALGMMGEAILGENLGITSSKVVEKQREVLANFHLPTQLQFQINREEFFSALHQDKKKEKGRIKLVFLRDFGQPIWGVEVNDNKIEEALSYLER